MTDLGPLNIEERDWVQWFAQNSRKFSIGAGTVVVVAAAVWWYQTSNVRKEQFASQALEQARQSAEAGNLPLAASDLSRIVDRFDGTRASDQAVILLAQVRLLQGQTDIAIQSLQSFVNSRHPAFAKASAYGLMGGGLEDRGKLREAGDAYRLAAENAQLDFQKAQYLIDASRAFAAAGDTASAKSALGELLSKYGDLDQSAEARVRMGELGGVVPEPPAAFAAVRAGRQAAR